MPRCIVCEESIATHKIKDTSDFYCTDCALENFDDLAVLVEVEQQALRLARVVGDSLEDDEQQ